MPPSPASPRRGRPGSSWGGFLGYYRVQSVLHHNRRRAARPIGRTVMDNYRRGVPAWLLGLRGEPHLSVIEHDVTRPLPPGLPPFHYVNPVTGLALPAASSAAGSAP